MTFRVSATEYELALPVLRSSCRIGRWHHYKLDWLGSPAFLTGAALFFVGFSINVWADSVLFGLRKSDDDKSYKVPKGFLYEWVSCPNYPGREPRVGRLGHYDVVVGRPLLLPVYLCKPFPQSVGSSCMVQEQV